MKAILGMGELGQWWPCVLSIVIMIQFADENLPYRQTVGIGTIHQLHSGKKVFLFCLLGKCYLEKQKYYKALTAAVFEYSSFQK